VPSRSRTFPCPWRFPCPNSLCFSRANYLQHIYLLFSDPEIPYTIGVMPTHPQSSHRTASLASSTKQHVSRAEDLDRSFTRHDLQRTSSQWNLGASSDMASMNDESLYDASQAQSSNPSDTGSDKENRRHRKDHVSDNDQKADTSDKSKSPVPHMVRFVNRPQGTPLFTIIEQHSLATLRSKASNLTFRIRASRGRASKQTDSEPDVIVKGPRAASADDIMFLRSLREEIAPWTASESVADTSTHHEPLQPPFKPPFRRTTPEGVRRWPADGTPASRQSHSGRSLASRARTVLHDRKALRRRVSGFIRRGLWAYQQPGTRPWRPPASAQSTAGTANLAHHPFQTAMIAPIYQNSRVCQESQRTNGASSGTTQMPMANSSRRANDSSSAQIALEAVSGNMLPARPLPTFQAYRVPRKATVPKKHLKRKAVSPLPSPVAVRTPLYGNEYSSDTLRTLDLIERFPRPPHPRMPLCNGVDATLSLFAPQPQRVPSARIIEVEADDAVARSCNSRDIGEDQDQQVSSRVDVGSKQASSEASGGLATPPIRGESRLRYTLHGTVLYELDAASLTSHDRTRLHELSDRGTASDSHGNDELAAAVTAPHNTPVSVTTLPTPVLDGGARARPSFDITPTTVTYLGLLCPHLQEQTLAGPGRVEKRQHA